MPRLALSNLWDIAEVARLNRCYRRKSGALNQLSVDRRNFVMALGLAWAAPAIASAQVGQTRAPARHPSLQVAMDHLTHRRWDRVAELVRSLRPQSACVLIDEMGDATAIDAPMEGLARQPMGATIAGGLLVNWGWRFRGGGIGSAVAPSAFAEFQQRLEGARDALNTALTSDANDGVAAALLIRVEKGRQDLRSADEAFHRFEQAGRRPIAGYSGYADTISGKWYGSQQRMQAFARQHKASLMPESQGLIPQAHNETLLSLLTSSSADDVRSASSYLTGDFVRAEIMSANDAFHSVSPNVDIYANRFAYGQFSFAFVQMGERELARPHLTGMGPSPAGPWDRLPDSDQILQRLRQELGLADL